MHTACAGCSTLAWQPKKKIKKNDRKMTLFKIWVQHEKLPPVDACSIGGAATHIYGTRAQRTTECVYCTCYLPANQYTVVMDWPLSMVTAGPLRCRCCMLVPCWLIMCVLVWACLVQKWSAHGMGWMSASTATGC